MIMIMIIFYFYPIIISFHFSTIYVHDDDGVDDHGHHDDVDDRRDGGDHDGDDGDVLLLQYAHISFLIKSMSYFILP